MSNALITLTTDFGLSDHFVGAMKGVILGIAPKAQVVDITHNVPAYSVTEGAFTIAEAWSYFPKGTIHVVVVDPGVGTARRPILVKAAGHFLIAPDNGVLSMVVDSVPHKVRVISNPKMMRDEISQTFHGRDVFAPAAAYLARGVKPAEFGEIIEDYVRLEIARPVETAPHTWRGAVLKADRFGNLITNFHVEQFASVQTIPFEIRVGDAKIDRLARNYAETEVGEIFAIIGSSGYLEIAANQASAAQKLGCAAGAVVELKLIPQET